MAEGQAPRNPYLTGPMDRILRLMRASARANDEWAGELVNEKRTWMVGLDRVPGKECLQLLRLAFIKKEQFSSGNQGYDIYVMSQEGDLALDNSDYVPAGIVAQRTGARAVIVGHDGSQTCEFTGCGPSK